MRIDVQTGGTSRGLRDARAGLAHISMVSRNVKEADLIRFTIAIDGVALIVHRDNSLAQLTREQITGIYTRKIGNWSELGRPNEKIVLVNKADGRSTLETF